MKSENLTSQWSTAQKIGFRFLFIYFILFICFQNNGAFPYWYVIFKYPFEALNAFIPWLCSNVFGIAEEVTYKYTGSVDTLFDYMVVLTLFSIAVFASLIWSLIDRNQGNYSKLYYWLTVAVRYYIAFMLIDYGFSKIIQLQFAPPGPYRLISSIGDTSPMGLAWTFLGFSHVYRVL